MFADDSCKMSPEAEASPGSGACPGCALAVGKGRGGRHLCPAGPGGMRGTGEEAAAVPALSLAPRIPALPGSSSRCLVSHVLSRGEERGLGPPPEREGSSEWEGSGLSPAHLRPRFPASLAPGVAPRSRRQGAAGEDAPGPARARPSALVRLRTRQGYIDPGRASELPFLWPVPPPRGAWGQEERVDILRGSSDKAVGERLPPRNSPRASGSW